MTKAAKDEQELRDELHNLSLKLKILEDEAHKANKGQEELAKHLGTLSVEYETLRKRVYEDMGAVREQVSKLSSDLRKQVDEVTDRAVLVKSQAIGESIDRKIQTRM